jgi:hypothetical protein
MELHVSTTGPAYLGLRPVLKRTLQMRRSALDRYLIEMLEQDAWIEGIKYMLSDYGVEGRPWPTYRDEDHVWM